ncbi:MAG: hypothetical protein HY978_04970 [Candidatus Liptonbacteria bacterium]|nr:hypothetical protein [Candidatus Liptonbacteria bacterium]
MCTTKNIMSINAFRSFRYQIGLVLGSALLAGIAFLVPATSQAATCPGGFPQRVYPAGGYSFSCGGLTFSNFQAVSAAAGNPGTPQIDLISATLESDGRVTLNFNPNLGGDAVNYQDIALYFQITGDTRAVSLNVGGNKASIQETVCDAPSSVSAPSCAPQHLMANLSSASNYGYATANYTGGGRSTVYVFKDINVQPGGQLSIFSQTYTPALLPPSCTAQNSTVYVGDSAIFTATGGNNVFAWSASGGNPANGSGSSFTTRFSTTGIKTVQVTSVNLSAQCTVNVIQPACYAPEVQTLAASATSQNSATVRASVNTHGRSTQVRFEYGTTPSLGGATSYQNVDTSGGDPATVTVNLTGLAPNTTYYYRAVVQNSCGSTNGSILTVTTGQNVFTPICSAVSNPVNSGNAATFSAVGGDGTYQWSAPDGSPASGAGNAFSTTYSASGVKTVTVSSGGYSGTCSVTVNPPACQVPQAQTGSASNVTQTGAVLNGTVGGTVAGARFEYGTTLTFGQTITAQVNGTAATAQLSGLQSNTTYYYRLMVQNSCGTTGGEVKTFTTSGSPVAPVCTALQSTANLNTNVSFSASGGDGTYLWAAVGGSPTSGSGGTFNTKYATAGTKTITVSSANLIGTCTVAINPDACQVPVVQTLGALNVGQTEATLSGSAPNASSTRFEYGTSVSLGQTIAAIPSGSNVSALLTGLSPNTIYFFRLVAQNSCGSTNGAVISFTTGQQANTPSCYATSPVISINNSVTFYASGGNGTYSWNFGEGIPSTASGQSGSTAFQTPGFKTVTVTSNNLTSQCSVNVNGPYIPPAPIYYPPVLPPTQPIALPVSLQVTKMVRNLATNQSVFATTADAQGGDTLEYEIRVRNTDVAPGSVALRDALPLGLTYLAGTTQVANAPAPDGLTTNDFPIGTLGPNQEVVVRFRAQVAADIDSGSITNQVTAKMNSGSQTAFATALIRPRGQVLGVADIATGAEDNLVWALWIGFLCATILYLIKFQVLPRSRVRANRTRREG